MISRWLKCAWFLLSLVSVAPALFAASNQQVALQAIQTQTLKNGKVLLTFNFNAPLSQAPREFVMTDPDRIVWDFYNVSNATKLKRKTIAMFPLRNAVLVDSTNRLRVLLQLQQSAQFTTRIDRNKMYVTLAAGHSTATGATSSAVKKSHQIEELDFRAGTIAGSGQLILNLSDSKLKTNLEEQDGKLAITLFDTKLPEKLQHRYDVKDYNSPVSFIDAKQVGDNVQLLINSSAKYVHTAYQVDKKFVVDFNPVDQTKQDIASNKNFTGELVSLNFQNIQVRSVLQLLAEFTGKNIIISNGVSGDITLRLKDIPWDQALALILKTRGLAEREVGNIIMIAPASEINAIESADLENKKKMADLAPLYSETFHINYGNAENYYDMLKGNVSTGTSSGVTGLLSSRGRVLVDKRTNTLFVDDTEDQLKAIRSLLKQTDVAVRQVMIEARVVAVSKTFERDLGINFGAKRNGDLAQGGFNMDLGGSTSGAGRSNLNLKFSRLPSDYLLDLELSALESENDADVISSPRVITADNIKATIEQGQQIPFTTQAASGGTTTQFVNASLKLEVTPQITPDGKIIMKLLVTKDVPKKADDGTTVIDTKKVETNILVNNGETIVLGGIYERTQSNSENRVPYLSQIPILGYLFRAKSVTDDRTELLVFVTPKIINPKTSP